ncbi:disintegrin and metalloproteinase domain-containing protein unc-71-like isoform X2 [Dreissena polymorpha]|uniref:disintegrin and metalloproteinase domain-containing protein unc-71-like isoform X2 n=1 Tax=Dreissena polymorpha TaxID=45954 RepID=UPI0022645CA6|nr:disintegrin and metalloproteinase domain-containing protein unc-71-like isoform X2 [Dreissena polymorpha]
MGLDNLKRFIIVWSLFNGIICNDQELDVSSLLRKHPFNQFLFSTVPKPFHIVNPKQVVRQSLEPVDTRERQLPHHGIYEHAEQVTFQIVIDKKKHKLKLQRNDKLFSAGIQVKYFQDEKSQREIVTKTVEHCYYQGTVRRDEWSAVAVSTCQGIRGVIQMNNETYLIHPMEGGVAGEEWPHMIYKGSNSEVESCGNSQGKWLPFHELHKNDYISKLKYLNHKRKQNPESDSPLVTNKFLKLALVLDNSMYWSLNLTVQDMLQYAALTANIVDMYYEELNVDVALSYVEFWNTRNRIPVTERLRETLENFMKFQDTHLRDAEYHTAHLLTRRRFESTSVGMAVPDSVCTSRAGGINWNPSYLQIQQGATILSHMIGHNLGIKHDEDGGCDCKDEFGCIMSTEVLGTPDLHSRMFSRCSYKDWDISLNMGIANCLTLDPQPKFQQTCGNKYVERGEECDCGSPEECALSDPCCDPGTCLLKYWAQCRTGACCHNCSYLATDYVCRERSTDCDVPEFCTGRDGECPANNYAKDGHTCNNNTGYCMGGVCPTLDKQCQHIWGSDALKADGQCYERFNPTGNFNGHCGKENSTGSYAKCLPEDIQCGLLHCSGGLKQPLYGPDKDSSKTTFSSNGHEYECKTVHGPSTLDLPNLGIVLDGTRCGEERVCMNRKCVALTNLQPLQCPGMSQGATCLGRGVCTKDDTCFCDPIWAGPDCSVRLKAPRPALSLHSLHTTTVVTTTSAEKVRVMPLNVTFTSPPHAVTTDMSSSAVVQAKENSWMDTKWMMIILAGVVGGLALLLGVSFLCYRRRSPKTSKKKKKFIHHCEEGEVESANKLIKFGSLPSYRDEKTKRKKGKKGKKGDKSAEDSDVELPPPPVIISDPNSAKPEKGILKGAFSAMKYENDRRSSESNTATSSGNGEGDSVGPYDEIDEEDTEAGEIQDIFGTFDQQGKSLDNMIESSSFDFMLPPPFSNLGLQNRSPSPPRKFTGYDRPLSNLTQRPNMWMQNITSPPKSRVLRMRNLDQLLQTIDRNTIDLSPSPDDPPVVISPSTSEDVRSSSTDDRHYPTSSQDPQSPNSITSGSTCTALRPLLGSQWSKYVLHKNNSNVGNFCLDDIESPLPHINIPPPMNPINIRSIFNYGQKLSGRDNSDTPLGSQNGECSSNNGTNNSRSGYEKSSGYGSEHDPERFSIEDVSRNHSRSGSASPPSFSAVIRTGPNQIKLVPAGKYGGASYNPMDNDLQKLLDGVPRIDAGCYERSPILLTNEGSRAGTCSNVTSGTSTLETLKNSSHDCQSSSMNSETNTLVNSELDISNDICDESVNTLDQQLREASEGRFINDGDESFTSEHSKHPLPELPNGILPNPKPLGEIDRDQTESGQCIDRSLEEISPLDNHKNRNHRKNLRHSSKGNRPLSQSYSSKDTNCDEVATERDSLLVNRFSAIEPHTVDICDC